MVAMANTPKYPGGSSESATGKLLRQMHQAVFLTDKIADRILGEHGRITLSQFLVLAAVECCEKVSQQDIASYLSLTEAAVSRHTDILAARGLLTRVTNTRNRRAHILCLSSKGKRELQECKRLLQGKFNKVITGMHRTTRTTLTHGLEYIISQLEQSTYLKK